MKTKTIYIAEDDTEFETAEELQVYEKSLVLVKDVDAFVAEHEIGKPTAGMLRKQIPAFLVWQQNREAQG